MILKKLFFPWKHVVHLILDDFCLFTFIGFQPPMPGVIIKVFRIDIYTLLP